MTGVEPTTFPAASKRSASHCSAGCAWYVAESTWLGSAETALTSYVPGAIGTESGNGPRTVGPVRTSLSKKRSSEYGSFEVATMMPRHVGGLTGTKARAALGTSTTPMTTDTAPARRKRRAGRSRGTRTDEVGCMATSLHVVVLMSVRCPPTSSGDNTSGVLHRRMARRFVIMAPASLRTWHCAGVATRLRVDNPTRSCTHRATNVQTCPHRRPTHRRAGAGPLANLHSPSASSSQR